MKRLLLLLAFVMVNSIYAQTAKEIIDKNIEVTGGLNNWKLLNSVFLQGKVILGINDEYPVKIYQQRPNLTKTVITINKKDVVIEGYDGKKGYGMDYTSNKLLSYSNHEPESFDNDFIDWESKGFEAKYVGKEKVGNTECYKVELIKNVNKNVYYFDVNNYHLIKEIKKDEVLMYSSYKKVGHVILPYRIESSSLKKDGDYVLLLNKVEVNKAFPDNTFKF